MGLFDNFQFHNLIGKQAERPAGLALGRLRTGQRNKSCFGLTIKDRRDRWGRALFAHKDCFKPFFHACLTHPPNHGHVRAQGCADILVQPEFTRLTLIGLEQNAGLQVRLSRRFALLDQSAEMSALINREAMPTTGRKDAIRVTCVTCHRGLVRPVTIKAVMLDAIDKEGVPEAETRYRELREQYYGQGAFNFGPGPLNSIAETLSQEKNDVAGAISIMKLNLEFNPDNVGSYLMLGRLYAASEDKVAAAAAFERALELEPDNPWAKQMLERVKSAGEE